MGRPTGNVSCVQWSEPSDRQRTADCCAAPESKVRVGPHQWGGLPPGLGALMGEWGGGSVVWKWKVVFFCLCFPFSLLNSAGGHRDSACFSQLLHLPDFLLSLSPSDPRACKETNEKNKTRLESPLRRATAALWRLKGVVRRSRYSSRDKENTAAVQRKAAGRRVVMKEGGGGGGTVVCATSAARRGGWVGGLQ